MKQKVPRNEKYLKYIRGLPCVVTKATHEVVAHHVKVFKDGGFSLKPSDYRTVPLTPLEHQRLHMMGDRAYWAKHKVGIEIVIVVLLANYCQVDATKLLMSGQEPIDIIKGLERHIEDQRNGTTEQDL